MRAVQVVRLEGPQGVDVVEVADAGSAEGKVLVEVHAAGVSFPDLLLSAGRYQLKPEPPFTLGVDFAGAVREAPEGSGFTAGDRVACCLPYGGWSDMVAIDPESVFPLPETMSFMEGAALPMNYLTAQFALVTRGRLEVGETVLVHGAPQAVWGPLVSRSRRGTAPAPSPSSRRSRRASSRRPRAPTDTASTSSWTWSAAT